MKQVSILILSCRCWKEPLFISFISLYLYCKILKNFERKNLIGKLSVNEVLLEFSKVYEVHIGEKKKLTEIPSKVEKLPKLFGSEYIP